MSKELYDIGTIPPLGEVPKKMHAHLVRADRFGEPQEAFKREVVDVPCFADDQVLVYVMAAGINYNNVWAARGVPHVRKLGSRRTFTSAVAMPAASSTRWAAPSRT
jgi:crotonyl-CoA carboxylase/reductase